MKTLRVKFTYLPLLLLLLLLWCDRRESLTDSSLPPIFFPFGTDEGDSVVRAGFTDAIDYTGSYHCDSINIPYEIFNNSTLYVSSIGLHLQKQKITICFSFYIEIDIILKKSGNFLQVSR